MGGYGDVRKDLKNKKGSKQPKRSKWGLRKQRRVRQWSPHHRQTRPPRANRVRPEGKAELPTSPPAPLLFGLLHFFALPRFLRRPRCFPRAECDGNALSTDVRCPISRAFGVRPFICECVCVCVC